jgi:hypothetical protein
MYSNVLIVPLQGIAQFGRALGLGPRGCKFKSCFPDFFWRATHTKTVYLRGGVVTKDEIKQLIVERVSKKGGINNTYCEEDIVLACAKLNPRLFYSLQPMVANTFKELAKEGRLVMVEYILPSGLLGSFYLPAGTEVVRL